MDYEIVTVESFGTSQEHVIVTREDGSFESFPVDEANPRYRQFLKETEGD